MPRAPRDRGTGAVRKLPSGRWQARMLVNGRHISLGSFLQKADANAALRDALGAQDAGTWVDPRKGRITFGSYAAEWVAGRHDLAMRTQNDYEDLLRLHLRPAFGTTPLADISALAVRRWWARASGPDGHGRAPRPTGCCGESSTRRSRTGSSLARAPTASSRTTSPGGPHQVEQRASRTEGPLPRGRVEAGSRPRPQTSPDLATPSVPSAGVC